MNNIPFNKPFIAGKELFYIAQAVIENRHTAGNGPFTKKCQDWLEEHLGIQKALLTHSCTAALEMAAILCDIKPGDEIIMPSFTFVSSANAFVLRGGVPVFVDIRNDTMNINEKLIKQAITSRTKAILPMHYAGIGCAMDEIMDIAEECGLIVVEDAAQSLLTQYKGRFLGAIGHLGCLSFHETKNIISGEGGALLINDQRFLERAEIIWEKGTNRNQYFRGLVDKYTWVDIGSSFLPSELVAAFLFAQLEEAAKIVQSRRRIFQRYMAALKPLEQRGLIRLPMFEDINSCNGHIIYIIAQSYIERNKVIEYLNNVGVNAIFHYVPLHSSPAGSRFGRVSGEMKVTEDLSNRLIRLPIFFEMSDEQVDMVVSKLESFFQDHLFS